MVMNLRKIIVILSMLLTTVIITGILIGIIKDNDEAVPTANQVTSPKALPGIDLPEGTKLKVTKGNFFSEYRMERERTRGKQIDMLREIINNQSSEKKIRETASLRLVQITEDIEKEMKAENLVKSKGYADCVIIIQSGFTTVVVQASNLRLDQEAELKKLISKVTQCSEETLSIIVKEP